MELARKMGKTDVTNRTADTSQRSAARTAGLGILLMAIPAALANFFVFESLVVPGDTATTFNNIQANELLFRMGILSFFFVVVLDVLVAWGLYVYFRPVNMRLSLLMGWFRLVYSVVFGTAQLYLVSALRWATDATYSTLFEADQLHSQVLLSLNAFSDGWAIAGIFFGLHLGLLGYLVYKSGYTLKILGVLVVIAGLGYLADSFTGLLLPNVAVTISMFTFIGELILAIWLLVKGIKVEAWGKPALESV
jgi:hypothetical protein